MNPSQSVNFSSLSDFQPSDPDPQSDPYISREEPSSDIVTSEIQIPPQLTGEQRYQLMKEAFLHDFTCCLTNFSTACDFNKRLKSRDGGPEKVTPHYLMKHFEDFLKKVGGPISRALDECLEDENHTDGLLDLLCCPLRYSILRDPVILNSGHTVEKNVLLEWIEKQGANATNPFTRDPLSVNGEFFREDTLSKLLLELLNYKLLVRNRNAADREVALGRFADRAFLVDDPIRWCRLLSVVMPPRKYYVRVKGDNHFVLEARRPIQYSDKDRGEKGNSHSVLRTSFFVDRKGYYVRLCDPDTLYKTLEDLLTALGCEGYVPLQVAEREEIAKCLGKEAFLSYTSIRANNEDRRERLLAIVDQLENRYNESEVREILVKNSNCSLLRASISSCSRPSFTLQYEKGERKCRVTLFNGDIVMMIPISFRFNDKEWQVRIGYDSHSETWVAISRLDTGDNFQAAILAEWNAVGEQTASERGGSILVLPPDPKIFVSSSPFYLPRPQNAYVKRKREHAYIS